MKLEKVEHDMVAMSRKEKALKVGGLVVTGLGFVISIIGNSISEKTQKIEIQKAVQKELPKYLNNHE